MKNGRGRDSSRWRTALKGVASGPLLGFVCLALAPIVTAIWWQLEFGRVGWFIVDYAIVLAAAALNAGSWAAAILFGRTRQLRASWFVLLAVLGSLIAAAAVWPRWANDFALVVWTALMVLGFPSSMIFKVAQSQGLFPVAAMIGLLASAYLQPFVLLPLLFRWRLEPKEDEAH